MKILDKEESYVMEHQTGDVYSAKYTPTKPGKIGTTFQTIEQGPALVTYYYGPIDEREDSWSYKYNLNEDWGEGTIFRSCSDDCSIKYFVYLKAPFTGDVTLILRADDSATLLIDKAEVISANTTNDGMFLVSLSPNTKTF